MEYEAPKEISEKLALQLIADDDIEQLKTLCIDLGFNHPNWRFIQDVSVRLTEHPDPTVRGNAFFGLEYAARFRGKIEKNIVKPVILRGLKDSDEYVRCRAGDTMDEINHLMGWNIGGAQRSKSDV